jgi:protein phosphatase
MTKKPPSLKWSGWTNRGKIRPNNEDSFLGLQFDAREIFLLGKSGGASLEKLDYVFAVSDGMGGAKSGEFASRIAVEKITTLLPRAFQHSALGLQPGFSDVLAELFDQVHRALVFVGGSYEETEGMQATLSLCWFTPGWMYFGHIGDSRIYHLPARKKTIRQLTHDDTYVGWLFRNGKIGEYEARTHPRRNVLQKALGGGNQFVDPQVGAIACGRGDIFLLCSDGLIDGLFNNQLVEILRESQSSKTISNPAQLLVETSVKNSGRDNTTALVVQIV